MKHTPRPWNWDNHWLRGNGNSLILWYTTDDDGVHAKPEDARMIAAAPELLEALLDMGARYGLNEQARAAIAKATGETQ